MSGLDKKAVGTNLRQDIHLKEKVVDDWIWGHFSPEACQSQETEMDPTQILRKSPQSQSTQECIARPVTAKGLADSSIRLMRQPAIG
jgi:hypothetical protein